MQITMTITRRGSEDGFSVKRYESGETYELGDSLARKFIREGSAYEASLCDTPGNPPAGMAPGKTKAAG